MVYIIGIWGVINIILLFASWTKVKNSKTEVGFIYYWGFLNGSFVWEDLLVFSFFHTLIVAFAMFIDDFRYWLLMFIIFWIVRSAGETLYMFLEQFLEPKQYPHNIGPHLCAIRNILGEISDQKCFILMQIFFQCICVISISALVILLQNWNNLSPKVF